jgi:hypothetical protein
MARPEEGVDRQGVMPQGYWRLRLGDIRNTGTSNPHRKVLIHQLRWRRFRPAEMSRQVSNGNTGLVGDSRERPRNEAEVREVCGIVSADPKPVSNRIVPRCHALGRSAYIVLAAAVGPNVTFVARVARRRTPATVSERRTNATATEVRSSIGRSVSMRSGSGSRAPRYQPKHRGDRGSAAPGLVARHRRRRPCGAPPLRSRNCAADQGRSNLR